MELKRRIIGLGLVILAVLWLGNIIYLKQHQISEPVFMKHYYDIELLGDEGSFDIYYLVNRNDMKEILSIEVPDLGGVMNVDYSEHASYQYYKMKKATIKLDRSYLKEIIKSDNFVITDLVVQFTDGSKQNVNIGRINIIQENKAKPLQLSIESSSSSDNTGYDRFKPEEPVKITGLDYLFSDGLADVLKFYINDKPVQRGMFPLYFDAKDTIQIRHAFEFGQKRDHRKFNFYQLRIILPVETGGRDGTYLYSLVHYTPAYFSTRDLQRYIDERRGS